MLSVFARMTDLDDQKFIFRRTIAQNECAGSEPPNQFSRQGLGAAGPTAIRLVIEAFSHVQNDGGGALSQVWFDGAPIGVDAVQIRNRLRQPPDDHQAGLSPDAR